MLKLTAKEREGSRYYVGFPVTMAARKAEAATPPPRSP
jgi:hypothetical protein